MSKILISLALVLSLGTTSLVAAQAQEVQKLSKADAELLFGKQDVNVALLSDEEMEETQGEFWAIVTAVSSSITAANSIYNFGKGKGWWR
ncbi:hypothetical protein [Helicobacter japonicus]|uniref:hypothetical protein n=1 Tax=Helicobacter japonicus TaxID=425400 RepID=UPI0023EFEB45|nr:hypothetical protein [Helicobacter japonicus]